METRSLERLLAQLPRELDFKNAHFTLVDDLQRLVAVSRVKAPEAVIIYCARILEFVASAQLKNIQQAPSANLYSNLVALEDFNLLARTTSYWAHALRRMSNVVRHVNGRVGLDDAELSIRFLERWLDWYCRPAASKSNALEPQPAWLEPGGGQETGALLRSVEAFESSNMDVTSLANEIEAHPFFLRTPVFPAVLAEILLSQKDEKHDRETLRVLEKALSCYPSDVRLQQLIGLCHSREHRHDKALSYMEPLYSKFPDDDETLGIIGGVYKRKWQANRASIADLEKSHRSYRNAWKRSGGRNTYVGINTATTALWLRQYDKSTKIAKEVEERLTDRLRALEAASSDGTAALGFWDAVTLAEAKLLIGDRPGAEALYSEAFARYKNRKRDFDVCLDQKNEILKALDFDASFKTNGTFGENRSSESDS
jgi:hypothetical protein